MFWAKLFFFLAVPMTAQDLALDETCMLQQEQVTSEKSANPLSFRSQSAVRSKKRWGSRRRKTPQTCPQATPGDKGKDGSIKNNCRRTCLDNCPEVDCFTFCECGIQHPSSCMRKR
mmetsp:Transcript_104351/g.185552  ORF Transcript_104351/g.185552 Transcript_104351/m.185552 type:complete len:116 (-) Transcript_104351:172-519(-)